MAKSRQRPATPAAPVPPTPAPAPQTVDPRTDAMRRLERAASVVAEAQLVLSSLPADATEDDRMPAIQTLAEAENEVRDAEAAVLLFADTAEEKAFDRFVSEVAGAFGAPASGEAPNMNPEANASEGNAEISAHQDGPSEGDASRLAGGRTPAPHFDIEGALAEEVDEQLAVMAQRMRDVAAKGELATALSSIAEHRRQAQLTAEACQKIDRELARLEVELQRSAIGYPLTPVKYGGVLRTVGLPVAIEPHELEKLEAAGVMSRLPPEEGDREGDGLVG